MTLRLRRYYLRFRRLLLAPLVVILFCSLSFEGSAKEPSPQGVEQLLARIGEHRIEVLAYRPQGCSRPSILMVFHGNGRNAGSYLDSSRRLADRACFVVYAPQFSKERFPNWSYHRGGLVHHGKLLPEQSWTTGLVAKLVEWARMEEGRPDAESYLFGHSAGGQFLSRVAAYNPPSGVNRIILANPSAYVMPSEAELAPYGYGGLPKTQVQKWLQAYLAAPVTIFLGSQDTGRKDLTMTAEATRQGNNRLERGQKFFAAAKAVAKQHSWPFNWRLVYAEGVGHSGRGMLNADEMIEALGF